MQVSQRLESSSARMSLSCSRIDVNRSIRIVPVVASSVSAIPEAIEHGQTGLLVQPGDAADLADKLERAIADEPLRRRLATNGRERVVLNFDTNTNTARTLTLFRAAMRR